MKSSAIVLSTEVRVSDIVALLALVVTFTIATFAYRQLRIVRQVNRARFLFDLLKWYLDDSDLRRMFYRLDYNHWTFDPRTFPMSEDEPWIDHILYIFDIVDHFVELGVIRDDEIPIIGFEASRVLKNPEIMSYLTWLDNEYRLVGVKGPAYGGARKLVRRIEIGRKPSQTSDP